MDKKTIIFMALFCIVGFDQSVKADVTLETIGFTASSVVAGGVAAYTVTKPSTEFIKSFAVIGAVKLAVLFISLLPVLGRSSSGFLHQTANGIPIIIALYEIIQSVKATRDNDGIVTKEVYEKILSALRKIIAVYSVNICIALGSTAFEIYERRKKWYLS